MTDSIEQKLQKTVSDLICYIKSLEKRISNLESKLDVKSSKNEKPENPDDYLERKSNMLFSSFCESKNK
jgi:hypothetical protein